MDTINDHHIAILPTGVDRRRPCWEFSYICEIMAARLWIQHTSKAVSTTLSSVWTVHLKSVKYYFLKTLPKDLLALPCVMIKLHNNGSWNHTEYHFLFTTLHSSRPHCCGPSFWGCVNASLWTQISRLATVQLPAPEVSCLFRNNPSANRDQPTNQPNVVFKCRRQQQQQQQ